MKYFLLFLLVSSCAGLTPTFQKFDQKYAKLSYEKKPGFQILILKDGKTVKNTSYGLKNVANSERITSDTIFRIASNTKAFTAYLAYLMEQKGKLSPDDKLQKFFPDHRVFKGIKVRDLIHHTSGLHDYDILCDYNEDTKKKVANQDVMDWLKNVREVKFEPGSKFQYSNTGYIVLAEVIRSVSGKDLKILIEEEIFKPLRMHNSFVSDPPSSKLATGYKQDKVFMKSMNNSCNYTLGDDGIFTSTTDYKNWLNFIATQDVFSKAKFNYAYGWGVNERPDGISYAHSGKWTGYRAYARYYPGEKLWVAFLSNNRDIEMEQIVDEAVSAAREELYPSR